MICSWIPLIVLKFLLFNSSLLKIRIPILAFNCSYASSVINKAWNLLTVCGFHLHLRISHTFCGIHLQLWNAEQLAILACYAYHEATNVSRKFTFQLFVSGFHGNFVSLVHLHLRTRLKIRFWNPGTYKYKIVHLTNAHFRLVVKILGQPHVKFFDI